MYGVDQTTAPRGNIKRSFAVWHPPDPHPEYLSIHIDCISKRAGTGVQTRTPKRRTRGRRRGGWGGEVCHTDIAVDEIRKENWQAV